MKKVILSLIAIMAIIFVGCSAMDKPYNDAKVVYKAGKQIYKIQPIKSVGLEALDKAATSYDKARTLIRENNDSR